MLHNEAIAVAVVSAAIMAGVYAAQPAPPAMVPENVPVSTTVLPLNRDDPGATRVGALIFKGAVQIRSSNAAFGGISGLRLAAVSATPNVVGFLAVADTGKWLTFDAVEAGGRLMGVRNAVFVPIAEPDGHPAPSKEAGDAEAVEFDPATGDASIVYEQNHRIAHFAGIDPARPATLVRPPVRIEGLTAMSGWPLNGGGEAMARLPGGARIIIGERPRRADGSHAALLTQAGSTSEIGIAASGDFAPTDAIAIDATRILVLFRHYGLDGQAAALRLIDLAPALNDAAPTTLPARELARWRAPVTVDNMEGLAVRRQGERLFVYIVSDDNLNSLQRTLLMKFEVSASALSPSP